MPGDAGPLVATLPAKWTKDDLIRLHRESTNLIQFTNPDPILGEPDDELQRLYQERVQPRTASRGRGARWTPARTAEIFRWVFARQHKERALDEYGAIPLSDGTYNFDLTIRNGKPLYVVETVSLKNQDLRRVEHEAGWFAHAWPHVHSETNAEGVLVAEREPLNPAAVEYYDRIQQWARLAKINVQDPVHATSLAESIVERVPITGAAH